MRRDPPKFASMTIVSNMEGIFSTYDLSYKSIDVDL